MNPNPPTKQDAELFCDICNRVYHSWVTYSIVFEEFPTFLLQSKYDINEEDFLNSPIGSSMSVINNDLLDNVLSQIATLHDPAKSGKNQNRSIDLFATHVKWSDEEKKEIQILSEKIGKLYNETEIKKYRNKILAHNARDDFENSFDLFPCKGTVEEYFLLLAKFCTLVRKKFKIYPYEILFNKEGIPNCPDHPVNGAGALRYLLEISIEDYLVTQIQLDPDVFRSD